MSNQKKAAVFVLLGQSNAVGHGIPMAEKDIIKVPLKNVFGLARSDNQSYDKDKLYWSGYTSFGMNLAEEQDNTYSLSNCLAKLWQDKIDSGDSDLPDLYIVQIAIGAQGITHSFMWYPERDKKLIPGKLGTCDISLYPFTMHILSLLDKSFKSIGKDYEIMGIRWRGGEEDVSQNREMLCNELDGLYDRMIDEFNSLLSYPPIVFHRLCCDGRMNNLDHTGKYLDNMNYINNVFEKAARKYTNVSVFDIRRCPLYISDKSENGIFLQDCVHYRPEVNFWAAETVLQNYHNTISIV